MKAIVVYESHWGNTAAIAKAIAQGLGPDAQALSTSDATPETVAASDLVVAGAPVLGFSLPTSAMRDSLRTNPGNVSGPADLSHPLMREWLETLPSGSARFAAFETRIWWSPGGATNTIGRLLAAKGYSEAAPRERFIVTGRSGPLRDGEIERAKQWGAQLATAVA